MWSMVARTAGEYFDRPARLRADVAVRYENDGSSVSTRLVDISREGAFMEEEYPPSRNTELAVTLSLPDGGRALALRAVVMRTGVALRPLSGAARAPDMEYLCVRVYGMGVRFVGVGGEEQARLDRFVDGLTEA